MFISDFSIQRPIVTVVTMVALVVFGVIALFNLKVDEFPDVAEPVIVVSIIYPGAAPEGVEREVLNPIEEVISGISGVDKIQSTAQDGFAQIITFFRYDKDLQEASQDIRDQIATIRNDLPGEMEEPVLSRFDPGSFPIQSIVLSSSTLDAAAARDPEMRHRVTVTGAVSMAKWTQPITLEDRAAMRRQVGLGDAEAYVLYAASNLGKMSVKEAQVAQHLDSAIARTLGADRFKLLVRPHPEVTSVWPTSKALSADLAALVAEATAVVGVRTRLLAEAAVAGRPVVVLDLPELNSAGNAARLEPLLADLPSVRSIDEAVPSLQLAIGERSNDGIGQRAWRPHGDPVERTIAALEQLGNDRAPQGARPGTALAARPVVWAPVAMRQAAETRRRWSKESRRAVRKLKDRTARRVRRRLRTISEQRLAMRAFVLGSGEDLEVVELEAARIARETITEIARSGGPIIVGPWLSEAGFELLYWIPFVRWAKTYGNIREDRFIVVSRGGAQPWYSDVASRYVDLLSLYTVDEFRQKNEARIETQGGQKQRDRADFERDIVERASRATGVKKAQWLHPSLMYNLFNLFWMQRAPASLVQQFTVHRRLAVPDVELPSELPQKFVAAKFYTNASFPDSDDNRRFVSHVLRQLTAQHDVVLLNTGMAFDDHGEFTPAESARVHQVAHRLTPEDNLRLQTRIVGAADAYVGTYGGFSYLAPLCGVNALTFFSEPSAFRHDHLDVARRVFSELGGGRFIAARTSELQFLQTVLGAPRSGAKQHCPSEAEPQRAVPRRCEAELR